MLVFDQDNYRQKLSQQTKADLEILSSTYLVRKWPEVDMDNTAPQIAATMASDPMFGLDLDEIFNGENASPHQRIQQVELYPESNQGDFPSTYVLPREGYQNFLPQDDLASYGLLPPELQFNTFNQEDFPITENLFQH
jgi:hypothetical protein